MGILLKRKTSIVEEALAAVVPAVKRIIKLGAPKFDDKEQPSQRQVDALVAVGLMDAPTPVVKPYVSSSEKVASLRGDYVALSPGNKVVITNKLYPWVNRWVPGDTGVVVKYAPPTQEARTEGNKWALAVVKLDKPRYPNHPEVYMHRWELELAP